MKKLLLLLIALMFVAGCYDEHYWDARYNFEKYCSMGTDFICIDEVDYSSCVNDLLDDLDWLMEKYPKCSEEISQAFIAKYRNMAEEDSCLSWRFKEESEYEDKSLEDRADDCKLRYYFSDYYY